MHSAPAVCLAVLLAPALAAQVPCWETNLGTNLALRDDQLSPAQSLGFAFPLPGNLGTTSAVEVSSNGFVYLQTGMSTSHGCCNGSVSGLLSGPARICPAWNDLNPAAGGAVYFNALPGRAVVTWDMVPEYSNQGSCSLQLQMLPTGEFHIAIREFTQPGTHDVLIGVSPGGNVADPGEVDLSSRVLVNPGVGTVYEFFDYPSEPRDFGGLHLSFLPDGNGGYIVTNVRLCRGAGYVRFGAGCPQRGPTFYELFDISNNEVNDLTGAALQFLPLGNGGYLILPCTTMCFETNYQGVNLALGDDQVSPGQSLGFTASFMGLTASQVRVSSNGFVYLDGTGGSSGCCSGSVSGLLSGEARIAPMWSDWDPRTNGAVWFNTLANKAVITWDQIPEYGQTNSNTFQLQLLADGSMFMAWPQVASVTHDSLVGFSVGAGADDPGEVDVSALTVHTTGPASLGPVNLDAAAGSRPTIGTTFNQAVTQIPAGAAAGIGVLGARRLDLPLDPIGMPFCSLYASIDVTLPFAVTGSSANLSIAIPNARNLIGGTLYGQAVIVAPGSNSLGLVSSNGAQLDLGV